MHRFDLQDWQWALIADLFPSNDGKQGEPWRDHRTVLNGMFHVLHTGCPWRDLPERYGPWQTAYDRFRRYRRDGTFDAILKRLRARLDKLGRIDWDLWCFDGTSVRAARCAAGAKKRPARRPSATAGAGSAASCT
jgi:transposase